jgi:Ni/Co efflux regulator RcnB
MKNWIVLAAVGALIAAAPALADDHHDQNNNGARPAHADGHGTPNAHASGPTAVHMAKPASPMSGPAAPANHGAMTSHQNAPPMNNAMMRHEPNGMQNNAMRHAPVANGAMQNNAMRHDNAMQHGPDGMHNDAMHHAPATNGAMQNNAMRHDNAMQRNGASHANHADFSALHRNFNAPHRYHAGAYHRPQGWYSHRWSYGERLPSAFFARNYWLTDFVAFGLIPPPPGCVWVRYGEDALLVDEYTGEVIRVEYGVFF